MVAFTWALAIGLCTAQQTHRLKPRSNSASTEPFRTFQLIDEHLTKVSRQQQLLRPSAGGIRTNRGSPQYFPTKVLNGVLRNVHAIEQLAQRRELVYSEQHRALAARMFRIMRVRASNVRKAILGMQRTRNPQRAQTTEKSLDKAIADLAVHFQALSGGYAALRCPKGGWACCQPKRKEDLLPGEAVACRWTCTRAVGKCAGLLGPRIP
jgi:hypothetical protein